MSEYTLAFVGDIAFSKYFDSVASVNQIIDQPIVDYLSEADHCIGNIEGPVCSLVPDNKKEFMHHTDARYAETIARIGIDIWNLANNHALDFSDQGLCETIQLAEQNHCLTIGAGLTREEAVKPLLVSLGGGVGVFSITYAEPAMRKKDECSFFDWDDLNSIRKTISTIKKNCRWCVLVIHGGDEFSDMPMPYTRDRYLSYLDLGADIIVAHHPHVIQNYEYVGDKIIFYSLGNFIFDTNYQRSQRHTEKGELLRITFRETGFEWDSLPVLIDRDHNKLCQCEAPPIFTNIAENEYKTLWLFAARALSRAKKRKSTYLKKKKQNFWWLRELYACRNRNNRCAYLGKIRSYLKIRFRVESKVISYLLYEK